MSNRDDFMAAVDAVMAIDGVYLHSLNKFSNGKISASKKGLINVPLCLDANELGAPHPDDCRSVLVPVCFDNVLVPVLCLIEPAIFMAARRAGADAGIENAFSAKQEQRK